MNIRVSKHNCQTFSVSPLHLQLTFFSSTPSYTPLPPPSPSLHPLSKVHTVYAPASHWYNRTGCLGVKHQVTYLISHLHKWGLFIWSPEWTFGHKCCGTKLDTDTECKECTSTDMTNIGMPHVLPAKLCKSEREREREWVGVKRFYQSRESIRLKKDCQSFWPILNRLFSS